MLNIENLTDLTIDIKLLEEISKVLLTKFPSREVDLTVCNNKTIQEYNREYRGKDKPTDVLSFPIENDMIIDVDKMPLGSIVISACFVKERAEAFSHTKNNELILLFIHGMLHLLGFDHETDNGEMRKRETEVINQFHLPKSLIIRTEES
jgi:probable rRNA maturation factor